MLNIVYNVLFIILGAYLIFCGFIGQGLVVNNPTEEEETTSSIPHKELFISLIVIGIIMILVSGFNIYRSLKDV